MIRCVSRRGFISQVPLHTRIGDTIFIPLGSAIPFIIRPKQNQPDRYEMIGECYVHGIMNGEAFERDGLASEDVYLV